MLLEHHTLLLKTTTNTIQVGGKMQQKKQRIVIEVDSILTAVAWILIIAFATIGIFYLSLKINGICT